MLAFDHDVLPEDIDIMGRIMIVLEGAGFYPDHDTTKAILDVVQRLYDRHFYTSWSAIPYETRLAMFHDLKEQVLSHISYGRFGVPHSPPPHPDDDVDDIELKDDDPANVSGSLRLVFEELASSASLFGKVTAINGFEKSLPATVCTGLVVPIPSTIDVYSVSGVLLLSG
ncbi:hypothetical protein RND71_023333 [Anisodus tanguticus]|uniref:Uncharacterized protein n=1 Tax=Anisodus tanguticus TaxID=243964 RepID=A0AAE1RVC9_9SOLA|nr:hypothetical protein RND71_023333 [Anisodus tanguticus]